MPAALKGPITVAVLGSGAREHALAEKISESPFCARVVVLPGNDGMPAPAKVGKAAIEIFPINVTKFSELVEKLRILRVGLVVIGPDDLLAAGAANALLAAGLVVFGPTKEAARIESSKTFAKQVMRESKVPTAESVEIRAMDQLPGAVKALGNWPLVLKYDGLALGKGVVICRNAEDAQSFLREVFVERKFSRDTLAPRVLVEKMVGGREVSLFALTDGEAWALLEPACDHKRLLDDNEGPNTGGMGAYSPVPWLSAASVASMAAKVFPPVLEWLRVHQGARFRGLLYAGLMVSGDEFNVLEFNARFGDPETQVLLPRLESDLLPLLWGVAKGALSEQLEAHPLKWRVDACVNVVAASRGYPVEPVKGDVIQIELPAFPIRVYFAGVKREGERLTTAGGRVLGVTALGPTLGQASKAALGAMERIKFEGMQFRKDIGSEGC